MQPTNSVTQPPDELADYQQKAQAVMMAQAASHPPAPKTPEAKEQAPVDTFDTPLKERATSPSRHRRHASKEERQAGPSLLMRLAHALKLH